MYNPHAATPPSSAYQYKPQAMDDADYSTVNVNVNDINNVHDNDNLQRDYPKHGSPYGQGKDPMEDYNDDAAMDNAHRHPLLGPDNDYKPIPLRWPFLVALMALLLAAIGIIVYAHLAMPNSQSTAVITSRSAGTGHEHGLSGRDDGDGGDEVVVITSSVPITITPTSLVTFVSTGTTQYASSAVLTQLTSVTVTLGATGGGQTVVTHTDTVVSGGSTYTEVVTQTLEVPGGGLSTMVSTMYSTAASVVSQEFTTTATAVQTGHPYISYGLVTITSTRTTKGRGATPSNNQANPPSTTTTTTPTPDPVTTTATATSVSNGQTRTMVQSVAPVTLVMTASNAGPATVAVPSEVTTVSWSDGIPITIVRSTNVSALVTSAALLVTIVSTPPPTTIVTTDPDATILSTVVSTLPPSSTAPAPPATSTDPALYITTTTVFDLRPGYYFVVTFLPTFIAVLLSLPLRVIDHNAKMYQPFHALACPGGARGSESLTLEFSGLLGGISASVAAAWHQGEPVPLLTTTLVMLSSLLAPLATEALGLKLHGRCSMSDERGCAGAMGVSVAPAFVLVGVLGLMLVLLAVLLVLLLRHWRTGVRASPWNVAGLAALTACPGLVGGPNRSRTTASEKNLQRALENRRFAFGFYETEHGREAYGIVPVNDGHQVDDYLGVDDDDTVAAGDTQGQPFLALTAGYRISFFVFLALLLGVVLAYHIAAAGGGSSNPTANRFGNFVATNGFGVRFVMAALGVVVSFCWTALLMSVATLAPFQAMATPGRPQPAERSILLPSRPTNEISVLWVAIKLLGFGKDSSRASSHFGAHFGAPRDAPSVGHSLFLGLVALMTLASEFLPVLLANVPYRVTQTRDGAVVCARLVAGVLALMLLTLVASFVLVRWPALPADPRTVAGSIYYTADSDALAAAIDGLEAYSGSMALMDTREKNARVRELGRRYYYGAIIGRSGARRLAVDADIVMLDPAVDGEGEGGIRGRNALFGIQGAQGAQEARAGAIQRVGR